MFPKICYNSNFSLTVILINWLALYISVIHQINSVETMSFLCHNNA